VTRPRRAVALAAALSALLGAVACGDDREDPGTGRDDLSAVENVAAPGSPINRHPANAEVTIVVGSKNFTEQKVLGEIYAQGLEAAGFKVQRRLDLGDEHAAQQALEDRRIDGYPEYTGTALLSLCGVSTADIPKDPQQAYEDARDCMAERGFTAFAPTPFTSSNEVGVRRRLAMRLGLKTISDLAEVDQDFTLYGSPECRRRTDCLVGLRQVYGLRFARFVAVDLDQRHAVLRRPGKVASIVFTTDPQNTREGIVLLEDDRGMFPPYNSTFVARDDIVEAAGPALGRTIQQIEQGLTDEVMQELNARVDVDRKDPGAVAAEFLQESGLTKRRG